MANPISSVLDVVAASEKLAETIQNEKNTPEMVRAAKEKLKLEWDSKRDTLEAILSNPMADKKHKDAAFKLLQVLDS